MLILKMKFQYYSINEMYHAGLVFHTMTLTPAHDKCSTVTQWGEVTTKRISFISCPPLWTTTLKHGLGLTAAGDLLHTLSSMMALKFLLSFFQN